MKNLPFSSLLFCCFVIFAFNSIGSCQASAEEIQVRALCYGPGLYGNKTATGIVLQRNTVGIAHKKIKLGRNVKIKYNGQIVDSQVIDRGPYTAGADIDITEGLAKTLGFRDCRHFGSRRVSLLEE